MKQRLCLITLCSLLASFQVTLADNTTEFNTEIAKAKASIDDQHAVKEFSNIFYENCKRTEQVFHEKQAEFCQAIAKDKTEFLKTESQSLDKIFAPGKSSAEERLTQCTQLYGQYATLSYISDSCEHKRFSSRRCKDFLIEKLRYTPEYCTDAAKARGYINTKATS